MSRLDRPVATRRSTSASRSDRPSGSCRVTVAGPVRRPGTARAIRRPMPCWCAVAIACSPSSAARSGSHAVSTVAQSYCTSAVHSGDPLRSASVEGDPEVLLGLLRPTEERGEPAEEAVGGPEADRHPRHQVVAAERDQLVVQHARRAPDRRARCTSRRGTSTTPATPRRVARRRSRRAPTPRTPLRRRRACPGRCTARPGPAATSTAGRPPSASSAHHRRDLGEATLGAPDRVHLQSVDALVERRVVRGGSRLGLLGGGLGRREVSLRQGEDGLVGVGDELERGEAPGRAGHPVPFEGLGGLAEPPEGDARPAARWPSRTRRSTDRRAGRPARRARCRRRAAGPDRWTR